MSEVIVVTSGKGGVGKTTTSANVGTGLAAMGKRVVLIDTDIGLRNLDVVMGLENRIVYNLVDVVENKCRIKQALIKDKRHPSLYLMPSAQTKDKTAVNPQQMVKMINQLREQFDYIILDCPAGIEQGFKNAIAGADRALVVTTPEVSAIRDADRIIGLLEANEFKQIDLIINRLRNDMVKRGEMMSAADVVNTYSEQELADIIFKYGEEKFSRRIAANIVKARADKPIETTFELVDIIKASMPQRAMRDGHPARRTFQAIRIEVN